MDLPKMPLGRDTACVDDPTQAYDAFFAFIGSYNTVPCPKLMVKINTKGKPWDSLRFACKKNICFIRNI